MVTPLLALSDATATILAALVGLIATILAALFGLLAGLIGSLGVREWEQWKQKKKLRRALHAEIGTIESWKNLENLDLKPGKKTTISHTTVQTSVYDQHINELGLLTQEEIDPIVKYYDHVKIYVEQAKKLEEEATKTVIKNFQEFTIPGLIRQHNLARQALENHLDD